MFSSMIFILAASCAASEGPVEALPCPNPVSAWTGTMGPSASAYGVAVDAEGGVLVSGHYSDGTDLDPTDGVDQRSTQDGTWDAYVVKVRADGSYAWAYTVGSPDGWDAAGGVAVDSDGDVIAAGFFQGTVDFDPGLGTDEHTSLGDAAAFVTRLNAGGRHLWAVSFGGWGEAIVQGVALDGDGNILLVGFFDGEVDFDPGPGHDWEWGSSDVFVSKLGPDGSHVWTHTIGSSAFDSGEAIGVDADGNIYATGTFRGTVDFDPTGGVDEHVMVAPYEDIFVTKYYADGAYAWTRTYDAWYSDAGNVITVSSEGGCLTTGVFWDTIDFDPTEGVDHRTAQDDPDAVTTGDIFVTSLNPDGSYGWTYTVGGPWGDEGTGVTVDGAGNTFVTGRFRETLDFDPGPGVDLRVSNGMKDAYLTKLSGDGSYQWTRTFGGESADNPRHVLVDSQGSAFLVGFFKAYPPYADYDPGCEVDIHRAHFDGSADTFITKLVCPDSTGDLNGDARVDLLDVAQFQLCFTDEGPTACGDGCSRLDLDPDDDIDLSDFDTFRSLLTGPRLLECRTDVHQCATGLVR